MSWNPALEPACPTAGDLESIETLIVPRARDIGGFEHHGEATLPELRGEGKTVRLILGRAWGERAPARVFSDMFYADAVLEPRARLPLPDDHEDRGLYVVEGTIEIAGRPSRPAA